MSADWSAPDDEGVRTLVLTGRKISERRRLRRRFELEQTIPVTIWPASQQQLALEWMRLQPGKKGIITWDALCKRAGEQRWAEARNLLRVLLEGGWIELCEQIAKGEWEPHYLTWLHRDILAARLGMPDTKAIKAQAEHLRGIGFGDPRLPALADSLGGLRPEWQLKRMQLLRKLDEWLARGSQGTRREFAHHARGDTKSITHAEWDWLDEMLGLATLGIETHTPGLWLRAPIRLHTADGVLDLRAVPDAIAITPATLAAARIEGAIHVWRAVENRTSFEQAARAHGARDGVLWLPGFAPLWWRQMVTHLLARVPAPLKVSCDPDPAGIRIALSMAALWEEHGLGWEPWRMDARDLLSLRIRKPLSDYDLAEIERLSAHPMHASFGPLLRALAEHGKGEQEGIDLRS